ncbi:MAG: 5-oxoprolinase subunit PxpB [Planctomycetes bacterium]|nr:5-oxoprolinase subunit PxpB [Planctomycetota bacterium]
MRIVASAEDAYLVVFAEALDPAAAARVWALHADLLGHPLSGQRDLHPAYGSLLVRFDALLRPAGRFRAELAARAAALAEVAARPFRTLEVPVRYGGVDGPDLEVVAAHCGLTPAEVVAQHQSAVYRVAFLGFQPGFPYLLGLPDALRLPRRVSPRPRVPAGSVAIAHGQAGIYPRAVPGGWHLLGRTDLVLFDPARQPAAWFQPGDAVRFVAVAVA